MPRTTKGLLVLATISGLLSGGLFYWWGRLTVSTFPQCVGGQPVPGPDCAHDLQIAASIACASLALVLALAVLVRAIKAGISKPGTA